MNYFGIFGVVLASRSKVLVFWLIGGLTMLYCIRPGSTTPFDLQIFSNKMEYVLFLGKQNRYRASTDVSQLEHAVNQISSMLVNLCDSVASIHLSGC